MAQSKFTTSPTPSNIVSAVNAMVDDIAGKAASSHNHSASNITSGTLAVARGGTGVTANPSILTNLGSTSAASVFAASPRPGVTGTLPIANGGTGQTTASGIRNALGLGNTTGAVPIANGGTGATTAQQARENLGAGEVKDVSISGTTITVTFADGTTKTLTTQDTAGLTASQSLSNKSGYIILSNGLTLAWGVLSGTTGTFPCAFQRIPVVIPLLQMNYAGGFSADYLCVSWVNTTNFGVVNSATYNWIAIG